MVKNIKDYIYLSVTDGDIHLQIAKMQIHLLQKGPRLKSTSSKSKKKVIVRQTQHSSILELATYKVIYFVMICV